MEVASAGKKAGSRPAWGQFAQEHCFLRLAVPDRTPHGGQRGEGGVPTLQTTYNRAIEYLPSTRLTMSYVLVQPKSGSAVAGIKRQVAQLGCVAFTKDEFDKRITDYYVYQTGIGTNMLWMTIISFIVAKTMKQRSNQ
jgi:hypothetical protein